MSGGDSTVAGLMPLPAEARAAGGRPSWLGYIGVEDVGAATDRVRQAGGTVHRAPADIPKVGRFSVVADPQGATFMLFKPQGVPEARRERNGRPASSVARANGIRERIDAAWRSRPARGKVALATSATDAR